MHAPVMGILQISEVGSGIMTLPPLSDSSDRNMSIQMKDPPCPAPTRPTRPFTSADLSGNFARNGHTTSL